MTAQREDQSQTMHKHAAITIVSKNYLSLAQTLAESYKQHHPEHHFIIVLVDRADGLYPSRLACGAEVIEVEAIGIPDVSRFIYRYTIMELNTAVKPFALDYLFEHRGYETLLYIDPDIYVFEPLAAVYDALASGSIVLIPHMRRPFYDGAHPTDVSILQSGTYNLGFIGLRASPSTRSLLQWWMSKLYADCVVDIPNGLFVDQKWMDMVPGFYPDTIILRDPGYNAAYWNLHERHIEQRDGRWFSGGAPLVFFHFSGFSPFTPHLLSKHQDRHELRNDPALAELTSFYARLLLANGYADSSGWDYSFETLANDVSLPLIIVRDIMQWALRSGIATPDPVADPDGFCRFLMSRGTHPQAPEAILLYQFLLQRRTDVAAAYPRASRDYRDPDFRRWLGQSGVKEEKLSPELIAFEEDPDTIVDHVADAFHRLRKEGRTDLLDYFSESLESVEKYEAFCDWFTVHGAGEMGFEAAHTASLKAARKGLFRILNIYLLRGDIQVAFPHLFTRDAINRFCGWLRGHRHELELDHDTISLFAEFAEARTSLFEKMRFLYHHYGQKNGAIPSMFAIDDTRKAKQIHLPATDISDWLATEAAIHPIDHYIARFGESEPDAGNHAALQIPSLKGREQFHFIRALQRDFSDRELLRSSINFAGFLTAPSGMGESSRSMLSILEHGDARLRRFCFPHPQAQMEGIPSEPAVLGWPGAEARMSIAVANADSRSILECVLPRNFWSDRNVGYWVWETEELPARFRSTQELFDEIWTPSHYSAAAIRRTVDIPVHVVPHTLEFTGLEHARANRSRFGLPENALLLGYAFDPASVLERKNVTGLLRAFKMAFRDDDNCWLVLKVNGRDRSSYDLDMALNRARPDRVIVIKETLSRSETNDFMKSLDGYVSLHRSEGFGLTCAEAMALGLPVIATGYSGNTDFMNDNNSLLVPARVIETDRAYGPYPAGTRWAEPDLEVAVNLMRSVLDADTRARIGQQAMSSIRETLSPARVWALTEMLIS